MPKLTAPILSFGAAGQVGKTIVFSKWKGVPYARQYVIPANPRTTKQTSNRDVWAMIGNAWLYAPAAVQAAFNAYALGKPLTGRNKFFAENQKLLAVDPKPAGIDGFVFSPGSGGGLPPTNLIVTEGNAQLTLGVTLPVAPSGWTIQSAVGVAVPQQDPTDPFSGLFFIDVETVDPDTCVITGLTNGTEYVVGFFLVWEKPDGKLAYSISLSDSGTPTV